MQNSELVAAALKEDLPTGDLTCESIGIKSIHGRAKLIAKEDLILSGCSLFERTLISLDPQVETTWFFKNGEVVLSQQTVASIEGDLVQLLKAERTALNFLGHLSGIATYTRVFVNATEGYSCKILDTRKTIPTYRRLEKQAVKDGGGQNHRLNLSDGILVKENHIRIAKGITSAVERIRQRTNEPIEVEVQNLDEVHEAVACRVNRILLDNMEDELVKKALEIIPSVIQTEVSGGITLDRVKNLASMGVDFISIGALTHSAPCADLSLLFEWNDDNDK